MSAGLFGEKATQKIYGFWVDIPPSVAQIIQSCNNALYALFEICLLNNPLTASHKIFYFKINFSCQPIFQDFKGSSMSMIGCFRSASDDEIEALIRKPDRIRHVLFNDFSATQKKPGFLARLFGLAHESEKELIIWMPENGNEDFDIDKAWHGIHFLLCDDPTYGVGVLGFIMDGGHSIGRVDVGYGPARAFRKAELEQIYQAIENIKADDLKRKCDKKRFKSNSIYPFIWDDPDDECFVYLLSYFASLKCFLKRTLDAGKGILVYIN